MFDFMFHGLAMFLSGIVILFVCQACGFQPFDKAKYNNANANTKDEPEKPAIPRNRKKSLIVLFTLIPLIIVTAIGLMHPSIAFGIITLLWIFSGVLHYQTALENINIPIIIFLGSMFGITGILDETGALEAAVNMISPVFAYLPPFLLILIFVFVSAFFANILDNSVAAVLMAPVAVTLWNTGAVPFNPDALLMAVAAGASLGIIMPTHQATIVVINSIDFPRKSFMKTGAFIAVFAGTFSSFVIYTVWC
jgi:di/tricarboxylate transporter